MTSDRKEELSQMLADTAEILRYVGRLRVVRHELGGCMYYLSNLYM